MRKNLAFGLVLALVATALGICGCANKEKDLVGNWKASIGVGAKSGAKDAGAELATAMGNAMAASMSLELNADHTFKMTMLLPFEGTWALTGNKLTLTMTKAMGMDSSQLKSSGSSSNKPMIFDVSSDDKTLTAESAGGGTQPQMTFTKN